mgnify:CR=1 FL=1
MPTRSVHALVLVALVVAFVVHAAAYREWVEDDAYISLRYAQNLVAGEGLVFNPGERVEAYSNLGWVLLGAAAIGVGVDPVVALQVLGVLAGVACLLLAWRMARALGDGAEWSALLAPAWLAVAPWLARHAVSGLETVAYAAALLAAVHWTWIAERDRPWLRGGALVLLVVLRPEGIALAAACLAARWWRTRSIDAVAGAWAAIVIGLLAARWLYYGEFVPNTFHFKMTGGRDAWIAGVHHTLDAFRQGQGIVLAVGVAALFARGAVRPALGFVAAIFVLQAAIVVRAGGDWMHHYRFWTPLLPIAAAFAAAGAGEIARSLERAGRHAAAMPVVVTIFALAAINLAKVERQTWRAVMPFVQTDRYLSQGYARVGDWLARNTPADVTVAVADVGAVAYFSGRHVIDTFGLTDPHIARTPGALHHKSDVEYVLERAPDLVVLIATEGAQERYRRIPDRELAAAPEFDATYARVHEIPIGFQGEVAEIYERIEEGDGGTR